MKFSTYLDQNRRAAWGEHYVDYRQLKKQLKAVGAFFKPLCFKPL